MLFTLLSALKAEACIPFSSQVNSITSRDYISIPLDEGDVISAPFGEMYLSSRLLFRYDKDHEEASNRTLEGKLTSSIIRGYRFHFSQCKWRQNLSVTFISYNREISTISWDQYPNANARLYPHSNQTASSQSKLIHLTNHKHIRKSRNDCLMTSFFVNIPPLSVWKTDKKGDGRDTHNYQGFIVEEQSTE